MRIEARLFQEPGLGELKRRLQSNEVDGRDLVLVNNESIRESGVVTRTHSALVVMMIIISYHTSVETMSALAQPLHDPKYRLLP
jgi:hypothetical protein